MTVIIKVIPFLCENIPGPPSISSTSIISSSTTYVSNSLDTEINRKDLILSFRDGLKITIYQEGVEERTSSKDSYQRVEFPSNQLRWSLEKE